MTVVKHIVLAIQLNNEGSLWHCHIVW